MQHNAISKSLSCIISLLFLSQPITAQDVNRKAEEKVIIQRSHLLQNSPYLWEQEQKVRKYLTTHPEVFKAQSLRKTAAWGFTVGSTYQWYADNIVTNTRYQVPSTCRAVGTHCYIFVEDASWNTKVNQAVVDSVRIYFDQKCPANPLQGIYQMTVDAFGIPPDVDSDSLIIILLLDIQDGYTPGGGYAVGYFQPLNEVYRSQGGIYVTSNEAEIYFLDTNPLDLKASWGLEEGLSTTAHEFQHMINFNYYYGYPERTVFINEGCSLIAEINCGYPIFNQSEYVDETNHYLLDWRRYDLTNVLHDYARAARFFIYLRDQAGMNVFKPMVASTYADQRSIDDGLTAVGSSLRFDDCVRNWFIANIVNDTVVNPLYGFRYPHLPKVSPTTYYVPNTSNSNHSIERYAAQYYSILGGSQLKAQFTTASSGLLVKAVEIGPSTKRVRDVPVSTEFSEPDFGTTYDQIHFVVMNTDGNNTATYAYTTSGNGGLAATTLSYAYMQDIHYYLSLPHPNNNQKYAVRFTPTVSGQLHSVHIWFNDGINAIQGDGTLLVTGYQNNPAGSVGGTPSTQIGSSVSVPFHLLSYGRNSIDMRSANVPATQGTDFHVVVEMTGTIGDTLQFLLDDGIHSQTNRTSSYRNGSRGLDWYNRADPQYGASKPPSYENLLLSAVITSATTDTIAPDTSSGSLFKCTLHQNYPNPVKSTTRIHYELPSNAMVTLKIYDLLGREIQTLVNREESSGFKTVTCDAALLSSGIYFYRITAGNYRDTKKMVVIK